MAGRSRGHYQFSFGELLALAAGFTAASFFIFFLGFYLGRGLSDLHSEADPAVARVPITEPPEFESPLDVAPALDALVEIPADESAAAPEPVAAAQPEAGAEPEPVAAAQPEAEAELESVAAAQPKAEAEPEPVAAAQPEAEAEPEPTVVPEPVDEPVAEPVTEPERVAEVVANPEPEPEGAAVGEIQVREKPESAAQKQGSNEESTDDESSAAEERQPAEGELEAGRREDVGDEEAGETLDPLVLAKALVAATDEQKPLTDTDLELAPGEGAYTVQLMATRSREEAYGLGHRLRQEGYLAYVKLGDEEDVPWYRVRIGSYQTITEARVVQDECNDELGFKSAYVTMQ